jgi:7,8-dihydropterin-6-yl-methyl-4-(beta-D-ribofuranosyl)aminobenzene 5'-phosphate synthase
MVQIPDFGQVFRASITLLVDNRADLMLKASDAVKRFTDQPLLAEHGFAALVDLNNGEHYILWDGGVSQVALMENLRRMKIDPGMLTAIALSHGHSDHTTGITEILKAIQLMAPPKEWPAGTNPDDLRSWAEGKHLPLVAHPAAFRERWSRAEDGKLYGPDQPPPAAEWQALGVRVIHSESPFRLAGGCWTTGFVPRRSFEQVGRKPDRHLYRQGKQLLPDDIEDDQAIVINIHGKGLVVLSGCAHAGIVNTVDYACQISGVERVYAILGGFHLAHASQDDLAQTIQSLQQVDPALVAPCHCTGLKALAAIASQMPKSFVEAAVGTTYIL